MIEQRCTVTFCVKLGESFTDILPMVTDPYGENAMKRFTFHRYNFLKNVQHSVEDDQCSGQQNTTGRSRAITYYFITYFLNILRIFTGPLLRLVTNRSGLRIAYEVIVLVMRGFRRGC